MLYGYFNDSNPLTLIVVAHKVRLTDFQVWYERVTGSTPKFYTETTEIDAFQQMMTPEYSGYGSDIYSFVFPDVETRDKFIEKELIELENSKNARKDYHELMVEAEKDDIWSSGASDQRTIEEMYDLESNDKWDRRGEEEKQEEKEMREKAKQLKKEGKMSGDDSFAPSKKDTARVWDVKGEYDKDGKVIIGNVLAVKGDLTESVEKIKAPIDLTNGKGKNTTSL